MDHPLIPLALAQRLDRLQGTPEWAALLDYLSLRENHITQSFLSQMNERDSANLIQNIAMVGRGALLEIISLKNLPDIVRGICINAVRKGGQ